MTTEKTKHQVCYELSLDSIKKIDEIAISEKLSSDEALAYLIDYAYDRYDPDWDYDGNMTINPRRLEKTLEGLSAAASCLDEELSELWLIAKNAR
jgi:signal transduction histidine kinase